MITGEILKLICPTLSADKAVKIASLLDEICPKYGINTPNIFHEFIANLAHESSEFSHMEENLRYSAERLTKVWPTRFPTVASAKPYEYNPKALAEKVYGNRADLGNTQQGDGWLFRGGGPIQTTGRRNYSEFAKFYNKTFGTSFTPEQIAENVRTNISMGIHSACWIFAISFKLIDEAENDSMKEIIKRINGGYNGIQDRLHYYELAKRYIFS